MKKVLLLIGIVILTIPVFAQNTLSIELKVYSGNVGAHFSWYCGQYTVDVKGFKIPTGHSCFHKIVHRDDDNSRTYAPNSWIVTNEDIGKHEIYIFDLADWDGANACVKVTINGKVEFEGSGSSDNIKNWSNIKLGDHARITDDREIAFDYNY